MEDGNISVPKFTVSTDINISAPLLEISYSLFLTSQVPSESFYLVKIK